MEKSQELKHNKRSPSLKKFQKNLRNNRDEQECYINNSRESSSESDSDSEGNTIRIGLKQRKKKKNKEFELAYFMKAYSRIEKLQKRLYKQQTNLDSQEEKNRYLKMDLNNAQVSLDEEKDKFKELKKKYKKVNWHRIYLASAIIIYMINFFRTLFW